MKPWEGKHWKEISDYFTSTEYYQNEDYPNRGLSVGLLIAHIRLEHALKQDWEESKCDYNTSGENTCLGSPHEDYDDKCEGDYEKDVAYQLRELKKHLKELGYQMTVMARNTK